MIKAKKTNGRFVFISDFKFIFCQIIQAKKNQDYNNEFLQQYKVLKVYCGLLQNVIYLSFIQSNQKEEKKCVKQIWTIHFSNT